jgi:hypothetical protein
MGDDFQASARVVLKLNIAEIYSIRLGTSVVHGEVIRPWDGLGPQPRSRSRCRRLAALALEQAAALLSKQCLQIP